VEQLADPVERVLQAVLGASARHVREQLLALRRDRLSRFGRLLAQARRRLADELHQVGMHLLERGMPRVGHAGQAGGQHALEARREGVARQAGEVGLAARDAADDVRAGVARKGLPVGDELVDDGADREDVGAVIGPAPDQELRRPVVQPRVERADVLERLQVPRAEVHDFHLPRRREPHVGGLEVEVQHALAVRVREALADLPPHVEDALDRQQRPSAKHLREAHPRDELGRDPGPAFVVPDAEHRGDVRVPEGAGRLRVALHTRDRAGHVLRDGVEELDRRRAVGLRVPADEHHAAPAAAELAPDLEGTERLRRFQTSSRRAILSASRLRRAACYRGPRFMVIGIGLDLVETARVARALERFGERFVRKLMDPAEAAALPASPPERSLALALAVAGKEAASKALGTGWSQGVRWRDVVVTAGPEPCVRLDGRAAAVARARGSSGRGRLRLSVDGALVIGEFWLLS
jgi:holo-[acyl-carrier protein] synthase